MSDINDYKQLEGSAKWFDSNVSYSFLTSVPSYYTDDMKTGFEGAGFDLGTYSEFSGGQKNVVRYYMDGFNPTSFRVSFSDVVTNLTFMEGSQADGKKWHNIREC